MKEVTTSAGVIPAAIVEAAWQEVGASFERFCLTAGIATLAHMMEEDAARLCGPRYGRAEGKAGHRWGEWMAADLSELDLLIIQIDGIHIEEDLILLAAIGIDGQGGKHPLGVIEGASENAAVAQALLDNLSGRGLDPKVCRLFIIDG